MTELFEFLKKWWFLFCAFASISAAWGADHMKLSELTEVVKEQSAMRKEIGDLKSDSARMDERTTLMLEMLKAQSKTQEAISKTVKSTNKAVTSNQPSVSK